MLLTFFHEPCVIIQYGVFPIKESMINIFVAPEYAMIANNGWIYRKPYR
jgi:hypothetical protein